MSYAIKEIFYTLQGEGANAGRPAVFCRFTGCNLWSGRETDRGRGPGGCSRWCDTDFVGTDGPGGGRFDHPEQLAEAVRDAWTAPWQGRPLLVCTGGEPLLQLDAPLIRAFHGRASRSPSRPTGRCLLPRGSTGSASAPRPEATWCSAPATS
jgi:7-carboxy-7-deazaguanine synthase